MFANIFFLLLMVATRLQADTQADTHKDEPNTECFLQEEVRQILQEEVRQIFQMNLTGSTSLEAFEMIEKITATLTNLTDDIRQLASSQAMIDNKIMAIQDDTSDLRQELRTVQAAVKADQDVMETNIVRRLNGTIKEHNKHNNDGQEFFFEKHQIDRQEMWRDIKTIDAYLRAIHPLVQSLYNHTLVDGNATARYRRETERRLGETAATLTQYKRETDTSMARLKAELGSATARYRRETERRLGETAATLAQYRRETDTSMARLKAELGGSKAYFTAVTTRKHTFNHGQVIKFHETRVNVLPAGATGGWNPTTGQYTCPLDGDYMFMVSIYKGGNHDNNCHARLMHSSSSDTVLATLDNYQPSSINDNVIFTSTVQAITTCRAGDRVSVKVVSSSGCKVWDNGYHFNQFSGMLLKQHT